jgi:hypothetical protein
MTNIACAIGEYDAAYAALGEVAGAAVVDEPALALIEAKLDTIERSILDHKPRSAHELLDKMRFVRRHLMVAVEHEPRIDAMLATVTKDVCGMLGIQA